MDNDCACVVCAECNGSGNVWYSFDGEYLGKYRCDDLGQIDDCPWCDGSGIEYVCDECAMDEMEAEETVGER